MPIMVGGNGPNVTWRLAARYADELNLDGLSPDEVREALPIIRARCEEIGRDPESLSVSVHLWWGMPEWREPGAARQALLADYAELGVSRVMGLLQASAETDEALDQAAADANAAGLELDPAR
jgi:alkanesulfonate monooxygenase SsuD/methylene tetrahydromethanopterin reductase-like flavin-dependent oxidoreductase (luciferase family)